MFNFIPIFLQIAGGKSNNGTQGIRPWGRSNSDITSMYTPLMTTSYERNLGLGRYDSSYNFYPYGKKSSDNKTLYWYL